MDANVPYMPSVGNISKILDKIQNAGVPDVFNIDFLKDLGFTSSNDRAIIKVLKYIGFLDPGGKPQTPYREFMDNTRAKGVLAARLRASYDDLFLADREANTRAVGALKGWFKTKTGEGDSVAEKIAGTFKALATYADWTAQPAPTSTPAPSPPRETETGVVATESGTERSSIPARAPISELGFVYRLEIHLPDTQNVETFRAIFRALREEMMA
jgi:hypothetical protein